MKLAYDMQEEHERWELALNARQAAGDDYARLCSIRPKSPAHRKKLRQLKAEAMAFWRAKDTAFDAICKEIGVKEREIAAKRAVEKKPKPPEYCRICGGSICQNCGLCRSCTCTEGCG